MTTLHITQVSLYFGGGWPPLIGVPTPKLNIFLGMWNISYQNPVVGFLAMILGALHDIL